MITAKPGDDLEARVSALYEPHQNEQVYDVMASGPITDTLGARIAYRNRSSDGYMKNLTLDRDEPSRDEETARITFAWRPTETFDATLKYEHGSFDIVGRQIEIINDEPSVSPRPTLNGRTEGQILAALTGNASALNDRFDYRRSSNGDYSNNDTNNATLTLNWQVNELTLTSISSWLNYKYSEMCDCDFTGAPLFNVKSDEDYDQYSQEFRIVSPAGKTIEYIAGAYYQTSDLGFRDRFAVPAGSPTPQIIAASVPTALQPATVATFTNLAAPRTFTQDTDLWSVFAQVTWNIRDDLRLIAGGRYTDENKDGTRTLAFTGPGLNPLSANIIAATLKAEAQNLKGSRDESNFAPQLAVQYDIDKDNMLYASATRGHKSGGFDARSNASPGGPAYQSLTGQGFILDGVFEYDNENATGYEIGAKSIVAKGAGEVNIAAFRTEYEDLQVSTFDGVLGFNVGNAAKAISQGVEFDSRWL
ncbi:conserved hypothetical protein, partial [Ricinus communis]